MNTDIHLTTRFHSSLGFLKFRIVPIGSALSVTIGVHQWLAFFDSFSANVANDEDLARLRDNILYLAC